MAAVQKAPVLPRLMGDGPLPGPPRLWPSALRTSPSPDSDHDVVHIPHSRRRRAKGRAAAASARQSREMAGSQQWLTAATHCLRTPGARPHTVICASVHVGERDRPFPASAEARQRVLERTSQKPTSDLASFYECAGLRPPGLCCASGLQAFKYSVPQTVAESVVGTGSRQGLFERAEHWGDIHCDEVSSDLLRRRLSASPRSQR